jgi:hypothetical protein
MGGPESTPRSGRAETLGSHDSHHHNRRCEVDWRAIATLKRSSREIRVILVVREDSRLKTGPVI